MWTDFAGNVQVADKDEVLSTAAPPTSSSSRIVMADSFATDLLYFHPTRQPEDPASELPLNN